MTPIRLETLPATITNKALAAAADKLRKLTADLAAARTEVHQLEDRRHQAVAADRAAFGKALADGKADPGTAALDEHDATTAVARRRAEALESAVTAASAAFTAAMAAHGPAWSSSVQTELDKARTAYAAAVEAMATARAAVSEQLCILAFVERFPATKAFAPGPGLGSVAGLLTQAGEPYFATAVLDALRADANPPAPVAQAVA